MVSSRAYSKYKEQSINTASPEELVIMLYDGCIKFINKSIISIDENDFEEANRSIIRAEDIILHLISTLDMNIELSKNFEVMYRYLYERLLDANISKSKDLLEEVKSFILEFRETWKEAVRIARMGK